MTRRVLGRVEKAHFIGRACELERIVNHPHKPGAAGLLVLVAPTAGVSELLRQAYDELFLQQGKVIPIYFALPSPARTAVSSAIEFLNNFLIQYLAFRRNEGGLVHTSFTLNELLSLAPPADFEWFEEVVAGYKRERFSNDDAAFVQWCLSIPHRVPNGNGRPFVMIDAVSPHDESDFYRQLIGSFSKRASSYLIAGLRRQLLRASSDLGAVEILRLQQLPITEAAALADSLALRHNVPLSEEVRDLLVQQFQASPFLLDGFIYAAREARVPLTSYLSCQRLYVDQLLGGSLNTYFARSLEAAAPEPDVRRELIRLLHDGRKNGQAVPVETFKSVAGAQNVESLLRRLHAQELVNWSGSAVQFSGGGQPWEDYLKGRYRLEILFESRARVVADLISTSLKRAPRTMARYYRRLSSMGVQTALSAFDEQRVPTVLFDYGRYSNVYKGLPIEQIAAAIDADSELLRLPQVVHVASCTAFDSAAVEVFDEERCGVAHAFTEGKYSDETQVVWLAAEIDSKLEAELALTRSWCDWLNSVARGAGFKSIQIWLIAREGFSTEAMDYLLRIGAYGSSAQQFELLTARLRETAAATQATQAMDEFEMVVPMGGDNELIVAHTVEEIARRLNFKPEAINQIKHAVVEAFINASEHSLSPERRIYQRFRLESDKLVITIASRGIVPPQIDAPHGQDGLARENDALGLRRGLGLGLIRTLMDEVEFERVDDGTSLRMTKYLRN